MASILPDFNINALFADDVSILAVDESKEEAERKAQEAVDVVVSWSKAWKLNLNALKSESAFFTTAAQEIKFKPQIIIGRKAIFVNPNPRLLGVILDCKLSFNEHVKMVTEKTGKKMRMLAAVSNSEWGWKKFDLMKIFIAHIRSVIDYAGVAWQPWISKTQVEKLDVSQNKALRLITRQAKTAPVECLRQEVQAPSMSSVIKTSCLRARELAMRQPIDHPRRTCLIQPIKDRLPSRKNCRTMGVQLSAILPHERENRRPLEMFTVPPWQQDLGQTEIHSQLPGVSSKEDDPQLILESAITQINSFEMDTVIYTDGSVLEGYCKGGAGAVVTRGPVESPEVINSIKRRGAFFTCSYDEEVHALEMTMDWLERNNIGDIAIVPDSQSLCLALLGNGL